MLDIQLLVIAISAVLLIFIAVACFLIFGNRERSFENDSMQKRGLMETENRDRSPHTAKKTNVPKNTKRKKTGASVTSTNASSSENKKLVAKKVTPLEEPTSLSHESKQEKESDTPDVGRQENVAKKSKSGKLASNVADASKVDNVSTEPLTDDVKEKNEHVIPELPNLPQVFASVDSTRATRMADGITCISTTHEQISAKVVKNPLQAKDPALEMPKTKSKQDSEENLSLKKALEEKERFIQQQKDKVAKLTSSLKELKHEMFNEKQKQADVKQNFDDQLKQLGSENENLGQKLREAQSQVSFKVHTCHQLESQILKLQENTTKMHQLTEENRSLKECLKSTEHENLIRSNEFHRLQQEMLNCKSHILKLEQQREETEKMRAVQDANFAMQLMESQGALLTKDNECAKLVEDLQSLRNEISLMEQDHRSVRQEFSQKEALMQNLLSQKAVETELLQDSRKENAQLMEKENFLQSEIKNQRQMIGELNTKQKQDQALFNQLCGVKDANIEELHRKIDALTTELNNVNARNAATFESELNSVRHLKQENLQVSDQSIMPLLNGNASPGVKEDFQQQENVLTAQIKPKTLKKNEVECLEAELVDYKEQMKQLQEKNLLLRNEKQKLVSVVQKTEKLVDQMLHDGEAKVASTRKSQCSDHSDSENLRNRCRYYEQILKETENRLQSIESEALRFENMYKNDGVSWKNKHAQLQNELGQRGQHLEKEMAINKQLNDKLASLGVTFTS